jgi:hypothetical protein
MEWGDRAKAAASAEGEERSGGGEPLGYVKVMTDGQMEVLRKQISIYATICEQLVEMHRALTEHQDSIAGRSVLSVLVGFGVIQEFWLSSFALLILRVLFTAWCLWENLLLFMSPHASKPHDQFYSVLY